MKSDADRFNGVKEETKKLKLAKEDIHNSEADSVFNTIKKKEVKSRKQYKRQQVFYFILTTMAECLILVGLYDIGTKNGFSTINTQDPVIALAILLLLPNAILNS